MMIKKSFTESTGILELHDKKKSIEVMSTFFQSSRSFQLIISILQILLASCFLGIYAQIKIPLYFTPVPLAIGLISSNR